MHFPDYQLTRRILDGDHDAFAALYDRHSPRVFALLRRLTGNPTEAEDLTQETFLAAYHALASWRKDGQFGTWLCGIAFRLNANQRRREAGCETQTLDEDCDLVAVGSDPLLAFTRREAEQAIEVAIAALPPVCREVFVLVKVEGLSYREAAQWLDVPLGTVQSRLWRAVRALQIALSDLTETTAKVDGGTQDAMQERS